MSTHREDDDYSEDHRDLGYPEGWPKCPHCGLPALDGHITCGQLQCDEGQQRADRARIDARPRPGPLRRLISITCENCGHAFLADSTSLDPEGCPECGHVPGARQ